jgi:hypothetical protein
MFWPERSTLRLAMWAFHGSEDTFSLSMMLGISPRYTSYPVIGDEPGSVGGDQVITAHTPPFRPVADWGAPGTLPLAEGVALTSAEKSLNWPEMAALIL